MGKKSRWLGEADGAVNDSWGVFHRERPTLSHYLFLFLIPPSVSFFQAMGTMFSQFLSLSSPDTCCLETVMMEDAQMARSRTLDLPVRTAGDVPLTLKERSATVT